MEGKDSISGSWAIVSIRSQRRESRSVPELVGELTGSGDQKCEGKALSIIDDVPLRL